MLFRSLKNEITDKDDEVRLSITEKLSNLEDAVKKVSTKEEFEAFKYSLEAVLHDMSNTSVQLKEALDTTLRGLNLLSDDFKILDINNSFKNLSTDVINGCEDVKEKVASEGDKLTQLIDANITRTINDITTNAEHLNSRINESSNAITGLCERSFADVIENIAGLKTVVSQLDDNNVSANNAIFSNITDRLASFESSLRSSLDKQETGISEASGTVVEQILSIKNIAENLDYKLDSSSMEIINSKHDLDDLKESVENMLALDFVNTVKDLKVDLYASKQDLSNLIENSNGEFSVRMTNEIFNKYELLINKLDSVEDNVKILQKEALDSIKNLLSGISSSIIDILSYVSVAKEANSESMEAQLNAVVKSVNDATLNYVENVRDVVDVIRIQIENNLKQISSESDERLKQITNNISNGALSIKDDIKRSYSKLLEASENFEAIKEALNLNSLNMKTNVSDILAASDTVKSEFDTKLTGLKNSLLEIVTQFKNEFTCSNADAISELKFNSEALNNDLRTDLTELETKITDAINEFSNLETAVNNLSSETTTSLSKTLAKILENFVVIQNLVSSGNDKVLYNAEKNVTEQTEMIEKNHSSMENLIRGLDGEAKESFKVAVEELKIEFSVLKRKFAQIDSAIDEDLSRQISIIEGNFESLNLMLVDVMNQATETLGDKIKKELSGVSSILSEALAEELEQYKTQIEELYEELKNQNDSRSDFVKEKVIELNNILETTLKQHTSNSAEKLNELSENLKETFEKSLEITEADCKSLKAGMEEIYKNISEDNNNMVSSIKAQLDDVIKFVDSNLQIQSEEVSSSFEELSSSLQNINLNTANGKEAIEAQLNSLKDNIYDLFEENSVNLSTALGNTDSQLSQKIASGISEFKTDFEQLYTKIDTDYTLKIEELQNKINELSLTFNNIIEETKTLTRNEVSSIADALLKSNRQGFKDVENAVEEKINLVLSTTTDISTGELQAIETFANKILEQTESVKKNSIVCKDLINNLLKEQFSEISKNIEKETDVIIGEITEQISLIKDSQKDDLSALTSSLEGSVAGYIIDAVGDLKLYIDSSTDSTDINNGIDSLRIELEKAVEETTENLNKLLSVSVFKNSISDLTAANEVLVGSMTDKLNNKIQEFIQEKISKKIDDNFNIFDKKFTDTIVDKYDEIKNLSAQYNKSFEKISSSVEDLVNRFINVKNETNDSLKDLLGGINKSVDELRLSFAELKAQIMNKSFDEAFHEAVHNQISGIENLVKEQMGYIEDIRELCCNNLPELTEMNTIVKYGIQQAVSDIKDKIENQEVNIPKELNKLKTDIITQLLSVFNQISFVAEQEEIISFIQEKHSELITILSHIVTTADGVETVKDNLAVVDNKIDTLKEDITLINEKITAIMSSEGDIDYVYSLQDLESDIANLRLVLNEMKADNKTKEFDELINSTNSIYALVEAIKTEMPKFELEEFKKDFANLSEDIVSISTRTNKLLLSSDESYKTLQDNLQDFKLVINDLDERTRNFAHESGMDRVENKLSALNNMVQSGAKTNQVFNQVFEYLAEWVDKAGAQITEISDKVESLDDIGQIKIMLEDLKAEAQDNSESTELVEALSSVFDKQARRIASLEAKLDRMIVDSTINSRTNSVDLTPIEETLNRFLVAMDERMFSQQTKIASLEQKLEEVAFLVDNKDTAQLTKKVGGMDRQLAKLNKSIEKIASNVVEK